MVQSGWSLTRESDPPQSWTEGERIWIHICCCSWRKVHTCSLNLRILFYVLKMSFLFCCFSSFCSCLKTIIKNILKIAVFIYISFLQTLIPSKCQATAEKTRPASVSEPPSSQPKPEKDSTLRWVVIGKTILLQWCIVLSLMLVLFFFVVVFLDQVPLTLFHWWLPLRHYLKLLMLTRT